MLFGATGMIGQGVLRECLLDPGIEMVQSVGRSAAGVKHEKLRETILANLFDYSAVEPQLQGFDACFFCPGVSSAGMAEAEYERLTGMTFIYVSGTGTDSSEKGRVMWARIKGKTENAILRLPFQDAYAFRPAAVVPMHGERSKTAE